MATTLTVSPATAKLESVGDTAQFTAEVRDQAGNIMANVSVTWSTDAPGVATVDDTGLVTAVGAGSAVVSASTGTLSTSVTVTVDAVPDNAADREALVALYESTRGESWVNATNWLSDRPLAEWHGVGMDDDGRVVTLALGDNGLNGAIPPEIGQLAALTDLSMDYNDLSGGLPVELGNLVNLASLQLEGSGLSGPIPPELGNLSGLKRLALKGNRLSGSIPGELGAMASLVVLQLGSNELSGTIPPELGNLAVLQTLGLTNNQLSGPIPNELGGLRTVVEVNLSGNRLSGTIPPEFGDLATLGLLDVANNDLSGTVSANLIGLPLRVFRWSGNPGLCMPDTEDFAAWVGTIRDHLGGSYCNRGDWRVLDRLYAATGGSGWTNATGWDDGSSAGSRYGIRVNSDGRVTGIDLSSNALAGELPLELGDLALLEELRLDANPDLSGRLPYSLTRLETLAELRYAETGLCVPTEEFLREWLKGVTVHEGTGVDCEPTPDRETLAKLYEAMAGSRWFDSTHWLTDAPLREWFGVDTDGQGRVTRLDLSYNGLVGAIPPDIVGLEKLTVLIISGIDTKQAPIPPELGELAHLAHVDLSYIFASGPIPPQLGKLSRLEMLDLANNALSGPIPPELGKLAALTFLRLDDNRLTGEVPHQLADATELEQIHLANNELSGDLPTSLAGLDKLWLLDLSGNGISGHVPMFIGDFERLEYLNLSYNGLVGGIPGELGKLQTLTELYFGHNLLSGPVPPELGGLSGLRTLVLTGNADLSGPLPKDFADLDQMVHLQAIGTKLCAPADAALLAWLDGLVTRRVRNCDVEPIAAYAIQSIQSRELPIALVADREALLRVFPTAEGTNAERMPAVRANLYLGGTLAHTLEVPSAPGPIPTELDESSLDRSVNARLPDEFVRPGLEMVIEVDPEASLEAGLGVVRRIPETGRFPVEVRAMPSFDVTFIPFVWETNPDTTVVDAVNAMQDDPEEHELLRQVHALLPVSEVSVTAHATVRTDSNAAHALLSQTELIATMEGGSDYYMGLLSGQAEGAAGIAYLGQRVAFSVVDADVIAHEFGHNLSLLHAPCGEPAGVEPAYPYVDGSSGGWGYDLTEKRLVPPDEYVDLMSYCAPYWVSDFSFDRMLRYRLHVAGTLRAPESRAPSPPVPSLVVWGGIDAASRPYLEPSLVVDALPVIPQTSGPYRISGATKDGTVLFEYSFDMPIAADGDGSSGFTFALPFQPGWPHTLSSITLSGPRGSFTLDGDSSPPVTVLRDGPAGPVVGIFREPATAAALRGDTEPGLHSRGIPEPSAWTR